MNLLFTIHRVGLYKHLYICIFMLHIFKAYGRGRTSNNYKPFLQSAPCFVSHLKGMYGTLLVIKTNGETDRVHCLALLIQPIQSLWFLVIKAVTQTAVQLPKLMQFTDMCHNTEYSSFQ